MTEELDSCENCIHAEKCEIKKYTLGSTSIGMPHFSDRETIIIWRVIASYCGFFERKKKENKLETEDIEWVEK